MYERNESPDVNKKYSLQVACPFARGQVLTISEFIISTNCRAFQKSYSYKALSDFAWSLTPNIFPDSIYGEWLFRTLTIPLPAENLISEIYEFSACLQILRYQDTKF